MASSRTANQNISRPLIRSIPSGAIVEHKSFVDRESVEFWTISWHQSGKNYQGSENCSSGHTRNHLTRSLKLHICRMVPASAFALKNLTCQELQLNLFLEFE